ncbi:flavohemoglobin expression-modulating QEGLA motif protein [Aquimarina sp. M1]
MNVEDTPSLESLFNTLNPGGRTIKKLPNNGQLLLEHDIPYLLIYQKNTNDSEIEKLVKTGASFLIIDGENDAQIHEFLEKLIQQMSQRFGAFLIFEIFGGEKNEEEFIIYSSSKKLPNTLKTLVSGFKKIESKHLRKPFTTRLEKQPVLASREKTVFPPNDFRQMGGTWISIEIPPIYKNLDGNLYPVYFKKFRDQFADLIQKSVFDFVRIQTTSKIASYHGLGNRSIQEKVLEIDKKIRSIQDKYSFLLLVSPINNQSLKEAFFKNGYKDIGQYHYRLLPHDPDILKRRLYNLAIDEIDDPVLAFIYDEKREEIDQELTMLKERGSKNFFYSSIRLYKTVSTELLKEAELILQNVKENEESIINDLISAKEFRKMARGEFDYFRQSAPNYKGKVHIQEDLNIMMVCNGELFLPSAYKLSPKEATALLQHEIGTHMLTHYNGSQQPLKQMAYGLAGYDELQEGIAVLAEYLTGSLCTNRLRTLAGRIVAGEALLNGANFTEMFHLLYNKYDFSDERAFDITVRMFQGGGFLKDVVYLKGLHQLQKFLKNGGQIDHLLSGKFALKHLDVIKNLTERGLLSPPKIYPRYLQNDRYKQRIQKFKKGIPLYKMI